MHNYLLEYTDTFSYSKKVEELIKKEDFLDSSINEYDLEEDPLDIVLEDLDTYSFLTMKKVILLKSVEVLDFDDKKVKHLLKYLDNPTKDNLLIMSSTKLDSRKKLTKELKSKTTFKVLESNPLNIIKSELKDYKISDKAIQLLIEYTNKNIDAIKTECDKLIQYKFIEKEITEEDIKKICFKHLGDSTQLVFDLVRYICSNDKKNAFLIYQELQKYNIDDMGIVGMLESQLRLLEQVNILMNQYKGKNEIAKILEIHPYRIEKTMELLRLISINEINKLIKKLAQIDYKSKSGIYDPKNQIITLLINL